MPQGHDDIPHHTGKWPANQNLGGVATSSNATLPWRLSGSKNLEPCRIEQRTSIGYIKHFREQFKSSDLRDKRLIYRGTYMPSGTDQGWALATVVSPKLCSTLKAILVQGRAMLAWYCTTRSIIRGRVSPKTPSFNALFSPIPTWNPHPSPVRPWYYPRTSSRAKTSASL